MELHCLRIQTVRKSRARVTRVTRGPNSDPQGQGRPLPVAGGGDQHDHRRHPLLSHRGRCRSLAVLSVPVLGLARGHLWRVGQWWHHSHSASFHLCSSLGSWGLGSSHAVLPDVHPHRLPSVQMPCRNCAVFLTIREPAVIVLVPMLPLPTTTLKFSKPSLKGGSLVCKGPHLSGL